jgi:hypothetical protein
MAIIGADGRSRGLRLIRSACHASRISDVGSSTKCPARLGEDHCGNDHGGHRQDTRLSNPPRRSIVQAELSPPVLAASKAD